MFTSKDSKSSHHWGLKKLGFQGEAELYFIDVYHWALRND